MTVIDSVTPGKYIMYAAPLYPQKIIPAGHKRLNDINSDSDGGPECSGNMTIKLSE